MALRRAEAAEEKCNILQSTATAAQSYLRGELQRAKADVKVGPLLAVRQGSHALPAAALSNEHL